MRLSITRMCLIALCSVALVTANAGLLRADLITLSTSIPSETPVIDFSHFAGPNQAASGALQVGAPAGEDITWASTSTFSVIGGENYGLATNGAWDAGRTGFVGSNDTAAVMRFDFNTGPVALAGGFVNYAPGYGDFWLRAIGVDNSILESYRISSIAPISTFYDLNDGEFRGIFRPTNDIAALEFFGAYHVLDDLTFRRADALPLPGSLPLFGLGALGLFVFRASKRL